MIKANVILDHSSWENKLINPIQYIKKRLKKLSKHYQFKNKKQEFTILLTNNNKIKKLNKKFRNKNKSTDVLSFPFENKIKKKELYLGDIVISYNFMDKPKNQNLSLFKDKVIKTFIHGFLHLLGFDHKKNIDYKKMIIEEEKIYQSVISKIN